MATLLQDDFSEANGTELHGKSLDVGGTWTAESAGMFSVQTGKAQSGVNPAASADTAFADAGAADGVLSATIELPASPEDAYYGLCARLQDGSNYWLIAVYDQGNLFVIIENVANSFTVRASASVTIAGSNTYSLSATFDGTAITATLDGGNQISYTSSTFQTETRFGLRGGGSGRWDNFLVTDLPSGHPAMRRFGLAAMIRPVEMGREGAVIF